MADANNAKRDGNYVTSMLFKGSDGLTYPVEGDELTGRLLVDNAGGSLGTVTTVSIVSANGFAGSVANATTTPAITLSTTVTGVLKGNGTAISAATAGIDYTALAFKTISVSGQSDVVADGPADTLTLVAGSNITITTNAGTDTITIAASGGGGTPGGADTQVQFNDGGSFGGDSAFTWDKTNNELTLDNTGSTQQLIYSAYGLFGNNSQGPELFFDGDIINLDFGAPASGTDTGGPINITAGTGGATSGAGGSISLTAGSAQGGNSNGGNIEIYAGAKNGSGTSGYVDIEDSGTTGSGIYFDSTTFEIFSATKAYKLKGTGVNGILDFQNVNTSDKTFTFPNGTGILGIKVAAPATAASAGELGMWAEDDSFFYVCIATNTWKRVAISTW